MELLLLVAKYGIITAAFLVVASSASKELSLLFARVRKQSKFVQLCVFAFIMTAVVYGGSKPSTNSVFTSTEPLNGFNTNVSSTHSATANISTLPQWYIEHGYPSTDTDGDGIPDAWERWTHTKPLSNDALVDYDGDCVDNVTEFMYMCDPIRSDTDGDGLNDNIEIDGMLVDIDGLNPVVRATFDISEPDLDGDGITDIWDDSGYYLFRDTNNDGFDDVYANNMPAASQYNFDVAVTITTTRTALLSSEFGNILIAPCTNKIIKLRLTADVDEGSINLVAHPDPVQFAGLWKAKMSVQFDVRYYQQAEQNRIKLYNGHYIDFDEMSSQFIGYISTTQQYGRNKPSKMPSLKYKSKKLFLAVDSSGVCVEHGPNPRVWLNTTTNTLPLYASIGEETVLINDNDVDVISYFNSEALNANPIIVSVYKDEQYSDLKVAESITIHKSKICRPAQTNIVGACWTSSHDPNDDSDHLPGYEEVEVQFGPNCPTVTDVNAKIGFSHDYVNTRNLPIIETSDKKDSADHCLGLVYSEQTIDLFNYIDWKFDRYKDDVLFVVNGEVKNTILITENTEVDRFHPIIYYVELRNRANNAMLDHMWITLNSLATQNEFNDWYIRNSNTNWIETLPKPSPRINITTNFWDNVVCSYPNASFSDFWGDASEVGSSYLHHNASFSARSVTIPGGHGNQACYDINGNIITSTIAGGTADYAAGKVSSFRSHIREDVNPYLDALQLDGNPGEIDWFNEIQRPCIYQGIYLNKYIERRPIIQPKSENQNENTN